MNFTHYEFGSGEKAATYGDVSITIKDTEHFGQLLQNERELTLLSVSYPEPSPVSGGEVTYRPPIAGGARCITATIDYLPGRGDYSAHSHLSFIREKLTMYDVCPGQEIRSTIRGASDFAAMSINGGNAAPISLVLGTHGHAVADGSAAITLELPADPNPTRDADSAAAVIAVWGVSQSALSHSMYRKAQPIDIVIGPTSLSAAAVDIALVTNDYQDYVNGESRTLPILSLSQVDIDMIAEAYDPDRLCLVYAFDAIIEAKLQEYGRTGIAGTITAKDIADQLERLRPYDAR